MAKRGKLPTYDPKVDGHVFRWIIRAAAEVRAERQAEHQIDRIRFREIRERWVPREPDEH